MVSQSAAILDLAERTHGDINISAPGATPGSDWRILFTSGLKGHSGSGHGPTYGEALNALYEVLVADGLILDKDAPLPASKPVEYQEVTFTLPAHQYANLIRILDAELCITNSHVRQEAKWLYRELAKQGGVDIVFREDLPKADPPPAPPAEKPEKRWSLFGGSRP